MIDKAQMLANLTTRQKVTVVVLVLIVLIVVWQVISLFRGGAPRTPPTTVTPRVGAISQAPPGGVAPISAPGAPGAPMMPQPLAPEPAQLHPKEMPMSPREAELMKLQQETEAKYIEALNELQMLKITKDIAETNKDIAAAKLATVTAEKSILDLLSKPAAPQLPAQAYGAGLVSPVPSGTAIAQPTPPPAQPTPPPAVNYVVISVSQLRYKWSAVVGAQGKLYHVTVGDTLPPDGAKVVAIDRSGVVLQKDGTRKKISMVSAI